MDFIYKYRRPMVVILALILIGMGIFQGITHITLSSNIQRGVEYVVMFGALYLLLVLPKQYHAKQQANVKEEHAESKEDTLLQDVYQKEIANDVQEEKQIED